MKVTPSEEYGLRCLLQIAREYPAGKGLSLAEIAAREGLPIPNTAKLLRRLRLAGIVTSARGRSGGYSLSKPPEQITLACALAALDGPMFEKGRDCTTYTGQETVCVNLRDCTVRSLWTALEGLVRGALSKLTLADLDSTEHPSRVMFETKWEPNREMTPVRVPIDGPAARLEPWEV
jgi:Rrf2 family protein